LVVALNPATLTLAPATGRPRRFTATFTLGVRLDAFGELAVTSARGRASKGESRRRDPRCPHWISV
jgi:hypothetical protein